MSTEVVERERWHLDKKIPAALILAMVAQFAFSVAMVIEVKNRGEENSRRISDLENQKIGERVVRIEVQILETKASQLRMETKLDRMAEREAKGH